MAAPGLFDGCYLRFCGGAGEQAKAGIAYALGKLRQAA